MVVRGGRRQSICQQVCHKRTFFLCQKGFGILGTGYLRGGGCRGGRGMDTGGADA